MISYKDKLLFLSFKKIMNTYFRLIENELNEEARSLSIYKNNIPPTLSVSDRQYACSIYDNMLYQNYQFKQMIQNINSELSSFHSSVDFSLSLTSVDDIKETSVIHLKNIESHL